MIDQIRNIGIIAHIDAGKTTATEGMLYYSGRSHRIGSIDEGTTVMDYLPEERNRGITITAAAATFPWEDWLIHLIDTPGHIDFTAEVERSLRVIDGAVVIFSAVEGVEAQSEKVWHQADRYSVPKLAFINKLDRVGASFERVLDELNKKFGDCGLPLQIPIGEEEDFHAIIDLITMEKITFSGKENEETHREPVPDELYDEAHKGRDHIIEKLADYSDEIAMLYLESEEVPADAVYKAVREQTLANQLVPLLCGSAKHNLGIQPLLYAVGRYLPSPPEVANVEGVKPKDGTPVSVSPEEDDPFVGLIFKVVAGKSADVLYMRTYSGKLKAGKTYINARTGKKVRLQQVLRLYARNTQSVEEVGPGDIVGVVGPRDCGTGDTLCDPQRIVALEQMQFPEPVISMAVEPRSIKDKDKLDDSLELLCREDPTLSMDYDEETGQRIMSGMGELHLEVHLKRLKEVFNTEARAGEPRVAYREMFRGEKVISTEFERVLGETELYAGLKIRFAQLSRDAEQRVRIDTSGVKPDDVSKDFVEACYETLERGFRTGGRHGYSLLYSSAEVLEINVDPARTTASAIGGAALQALNEAIEQIGTDVLEPMMFLEIVTPEEAVGDIVTYLQPKRAVINEMEKTGSVKRVTCQVPLAEVFGFGKDLPKLSGGRASFTMEPYGYQVLPEEIAAQIFGLL